MPCSRFATLFNRVYHFRTVNRQLHLSRVCLSPELPDCLKDFFDKEANWSKEELEADERPGREWTVDDLRGKSSADLHRLWYVLLKERNMLMTMEHASKQEMQQMPNEERIYRVEMSMENLESVVGERDEAYLMLEKGISGQRPSRDVTTILGFRDTKYLEEHYEPPHQNAKGQEYEEPYLKDYVYSFQKQWKEKRWTDNILQEEDYKRRHRKLKYIYRNTKP